MDFIRVADACLKCAMTALRDGRAIQPAYRELITTAAKAAPVLARKKAASLDVAADVARAEAWLNECFTKEPPRPNIKSFWFGLYEDSTHGWTLYAAGSTKAVDFRSINWAVNPAWFPRRRYFRSAVLRQLSAWRPKKDYDAAAMIDLGLVWPYSCLLVAETLRRLDPALLLGKTKTRAAACGYDDGDFMALGWVKPQGFVAKPKMA